MNEFLYPLISLFFLLLLVIGGTLVIILSAFFYKFFKGRTENVHYPSKSEYDQAWSELKGEENSCVQDEEDEEI